MRRISHAVMPKLAFAALMLGVGGCSANMRPAPYPGQTLIHKGKTALIEREGVAVSVTPAFVPIDEDSKLTAIRIEVINQSDRTVRLSPKNIVLTGGDGLKRAPLDPRRFEFYARNTEPAPLWVYRHYQVQVGVGYGGWHYPGWYDDPYWDAYDAAYDYYARREAMARLVATLWRGRSVEPGYVAGGYVIYDYRLRRKEDLTVDVMLDRVPTSQPTSAPSPQQPLEPLTTGPLTMRFFFRT